MFEKITLSITLILIMMFGALYYYQHGVNAPQECVDLHNNYLSLIELIESKEYKSVAQALLTEDHINSIYHTEKQYEQLLSKKFKRTGLDDLKFSCSLAQQSLNVDEFLQVFEIYKKFHSSYQHPI